MLSRTASARSTRRPAAALLAASLALAACGGGQAPAPTDAGGAADEGAVPDLESLRVEPRPQEFYGVDPALIAPDPDTLPELEGVVRVQELPSASGVPDPSLERLEPLSEWGGVPVEFHEAFYPSGELRLQGHRTRAEDGDSVPHGPEWRWFENGQLERRRTLELGKVDGPIEEWHESGIKKLEGRFEQDFATGRWVRWTALGKLYKVTGYAGGNLDGVEYVFHPEGSPSQRIVWAAGKKDGEELAWTKRRLPMEQNGWKAGRRHGVRRQWQGQGRLALEATFVDGKRDGDFRQYWKSGHPALEGQLVLGDRVGVWRRWNEAETLIALETYAEGRYAGIVQRWNDEGLLVFEGEFAAGEPIGTHTEFYDGGGPKTRLTYADGAPNGPKTTWHPNGVKASEGEVRDGQREGEWTLWGEDGERLEAWSGRYEKGVKVDE